MNSKIIEILVAPLENWMSEYVVLIDGVEYLPMDKFAEVYAESLNLSLDIASKVLVVAKIEVISIMILTCVAIFAAKALRWRKKDTALLAEKDVE